jgi:ribosomal protein S18 acetylase RimI-like enzyme
VSELRPDAPVRRPDTARPREEALPEIEPPSVEELTAIQRHLVTLPAQEGATIGIDDDLGLTFVRGPGSGPDTTYGALLRWSADAWPRALAATRERMRAEGDWPSLLVCDTLDEPAALAAELERQGWLRVATETVMWVGHASVVPHLDPLMRIEAVQPRSLPRHEELERHIFGLSADQVERRRDALSASLRAGSVRAWIIWLDQEAIAVARLSQGDGSAGLQGIGVVEGQRGQGYGTLMTTIATRAGMAVGNRLIWLSVREDNGPAMQVYAKLGFRPAFSWTRWLLAEDPRQR